MACVTTAWTEHTDMSTPSRLRHNSPIIDGIAYIPGGVDNASGLQAYTIATDSWAALTAPPANLSGTAAVAFGDEIHCFGGGGADYGGQTWLTRHLVYDIATDTWATAAATPSGGRVEAGVATDGTYIYLIGGNNGSTGTATVLRYDPAADTWTTTLTSMGSSSATCYAAYWDGKIYERHHSVSAATNQVLRVYNIAGDSWSTPGGFTVACAFFDLAAVNGRIYAVGGYGSSTAQDITHFYDIDANSFEVGPTLPEGRQRLSLGVDGTTLWCFGGYDQDIGASSIDGKTMCLATASATRGWTLGAMTMN
jgi:kelch-like protein 20